MIPLRQPKLTLHRVGAPEWKRADEGRPVHSFRSRLRDLATVTKNPVVPRLPGAEPFDAIARTTELQRQAFRLLGVRLQ